MPSVRFNVEFLLEIILRLFLYVLFRITDDAKPFHRKIHQEEMWLYKNPRTDSYVPASMLWVFVLVCPTIAIGGFYLINKKKTDLIQATLGVSLSIWLAGTITNFIKLGVGRPRPDFYWRCFPDGVYVEDMKCTGDKDVINQGFKSFPSGHSALSFSSLTFVSLYLCGKLHCFTSSGRGKTWRLCLSLIPVILSTMVAISRTADYHHHWQDVSCGSLLGLGIGYMCYRQFYPAINKSNCHLSYMEITPTLPTFRDSQLSPPIDATTIKFNSDLKIT